MRHAVSRLGFSVSNEYRTVAESRILDALLLAGSAYEQDNPEAITTTRQALDRWIGMGLGVRRGPAGERLFDPVEVVNFLKHLGRQGRDSFWANRYVLTGRRLVSDLSANAERSYTIHFNRTFSLRSVPIGKRVRLRVPLPLVDVHGTDMNVVPTVEGSTDASLTVTDGRLEARVLVQGRPVSICVKLNFRAPVSVPSVLDDRDRSAYLKPREGLIIVTDRVNALAQALAGLKGDPLSKVRAFWNYMLDELSCGALHYDQIPAQAPCDAALESGWYDCQLGSALFAALCRARGIPARLVSGHVLYRRAPTNHYWAEVWLDEKGWTPFDFLCWDLSLGGNDSQWRDHFYGRVDDRMVTQLLPFKFTGYPGVGIPDNWHMLQTAIDGGIEVSLSGIDGEPVYSDFVSILN
jgi:hypothetical protein